MDFSPAPDNTIQKEFEKEVDLIDFQEKCDATPENLMKEGFSSRTSEETSCDNTSCDYDEETTATKQHMYPSVDDGRVHGLLIILDDDIEDSNQNIDQICDNIGFVNTENLCGDNNLHIVEDCDRLDGAGGGKVQEEETIKKEATAFTVDFDDGKTRNEQQQKYEKMFERFQNKRHRRNASMTRFEEESQEKSSSSESPLPSTSLLKTKQTPSSAKLPRKSSFAADPSFVQTTLDDDAKVRLRDKKNILKSGDKSRHSWSPNSTDLIESTRDTKPSIEPPADNPIPTSKQQPHTPQTKFTAKSSVLARVLDSNLSSRNVIQSISHNSGEDLPSIDFLCLTSPLESIPRTDDDDVSEAGTYTLDGDNYTEEQKQMMDIDKMMAKEARRQQRLAKQKADQAEEDDAGIKFLKCTKNISTTTVKRPTSFEQPNLEVRVVLITVLLIFKVTDAV